MSRIILFTEKSKSIAQRGYDSGNKNSGNAQLTTHFSEEGRKKREEKNGKKLQDQHDISVL